MNKVFLIGNLTKEPEFKQNETSGVALLKFSIAVNRKFKNKDGEYETDFFNITVWRNLAIVCNKYLHKGNKVAVIGSIQNRTYTDKDGNTRYATDIVADTVEFLTSKNNPSENNINEGKQNKYVNKDLTPVEDDALPF